MPPVNDDFANATDLGSSTSGEVTFDITGATTESGEPGFSFGPTVWFKWTAPADARIRFDTSTTPAPRWDSFIGLFTGTSFADLVEVGYNDDGTLQPGVVEPDTFGTSTVDQYVTAGTVYWIQIGSYDYTAWDDTDGHHDSAGFPRTDCHLRWKPSPPDGIIFTNTSFGALRVGDTLDVTSYSGFAAVDRVNFTGASAIPTIIDDTHLTVVVPTTAVVGPVSFHSTDWGSIDSGYVAFYPWIHLDWRDSPAMDDPPPYLGSRSAELLSGPPLDARWTTHPYPSWMHSDTRRNSFWGSLATVSDEPDATAGDGGDPDAIIMSHDESSGGYVLAQWAMLVDFSHIGAVEGNPPDRYQPDFTDLATDVYHYGDPADYEFEDIVVGPADQWMSWMHSFEIDLPLRLQPFTTDGWVISDTTVQVRAVPVSEFEYDGNSTHSPRSGRWFTGSELAGFPLLGEINTGTAAFVDASLSVSVDPSLVAGDQVNGLYAMVVLHYKEQVTHTSPVPDVGQASIGLADVFSDIPSVYHYTPPRWRYLVPQYGPLVPPPQRQYPRDDGLAISTRRSWPPPTSKQYGSRRGPTATYW